MPLDSTVLAQKIEDHLDALSVAAGKGSLPDLGRTDREMLFTAIARAVVDHMTTAAEVEVNDPLWPNPAGGIIK